VEITRNVPEPKFVPVTITLNSQGEVNLLKEVFGCMPSHTCEAFGLDGNLSYEMFLKLRGMATTCPGLVGITVE
jgi:hypothetical protein